MGPVLWRRPGMTREVVALPLTSGPSPSIYASPGPSGLLALACHLAGTRIGTMTERSSEGLDERRRKLLFRAWRRGVREMDLIVGRFADAHIDKFDDTGLDDFERLMEAPNAALYAWVIGAEAIPTNYDTAVLAKLKEFHMQGSRVRAEEDR
jgi:antitoxin CptB